MGLGTFIGELSFKPLALESGGTLHIASLKYTIFLENTYHTRAISERVYYCFKACFLNVFFQERVVFKSAQKHNIHDRFVDVQPNSLQLEGGKNDIFVLSREAAKVKISHFC